MFDILPIIQHMPKGRALHTPLYGEVKFNHTESAEILHPIRVEYINDVGISFELSFAQDGRWNQDAKDAECVLFPSRDCRDWNRWAEVLVQDGDIVLHKSGRVVRFDGQRMDCHEIVRFASEEEATEQDKQDKKDATGRIAQAVEPFKPFDRVLVCNNKKERLIPRLFSQKIGELYYCQDGKCYKFCIPYDGNESAQYIV